MTFPSSRRFRPVVDRRRILLVESAPDLGALFVNVLATNGARVVHVATAGAVLEAVTAGRPDVVIIDLDGLTEPFVMLSKVLDAPVILLAGTAGGLALRARESGFRWVLDKPVPVESLLTAIAAAAPSSRGHSGDGGVGRGGSGVGCGLLVSAARTSAAASEPASGCACGGEGAGADHADSAAVVAIAAAAARAS